MSCVYVVKSSACVCVHVFEDTYFHMYILVSSECVNKITRSYICICIHNITRHVDMTHAYAVHALFARSCAQHMTAHLQSSLYVFTHVCRCIYMYVYMYTHMCMYICVHAAYIHHITQCKRQILRHSTTCTRAALVPTYTQTHTHTHIHLHML
jgi:hypothetical protein